MMYAKHNEFVWLKPSERRRVKRTKPTSKRMMPTASGPKECNEKFKVFSINKNPVESANPTPITIAFPPLPSNLFPSVTLAIPKKIKKAIMASMIKE